MPILSRPILSRRSFLRSMAMGAGASLFVPLLERAARGAGTGPRRFVLVVEGNCIEPVAFLSTRARAALDGLGTAVDTRRWFPTLYPSAGAPVEVAETDFAGARSLDALTANPTLAARSTVILGLSSKVTGGGHSTSHGALSCTRSTPASPGGITIDTVLSQVPEVRSATPFDVLRVGISAATGQPLNYETCALGPGRAAAVLLQPTTVFNTLFGSVASAAGMAAFQERSSLMDFARADVQAALAAFPGNSRERAKLESYLTSLEALTAKQQRLVTMGPQLTAVKPEDPATNPLFQGTDPLVQLRAHFQMVGAALKGELTHVAVIASGTGVSHFSLRFPTISMVARHDLHHGSSSTPEFLTAIHTATREHVNLIAQLALDLAATPEADGNGSMLDHTVIVYLPDNGEQHHSTASDWPVLMVGGTALGLRGGGRTLLYPRMGASGHRQMSNLFNTLGHAAGLPLTHFGAEGAARVAPGPLTELTA